MHENEVKVKSLSHVRLLATPWTAAYQAPPSMGFSRQECWSGVPWPSLKQNSRHRQIRGCQELGVGEGAAHKRMWDNVGCDGTVLGIVIVTLLNGFVKIHITL